MYIKNSQAINNINTIISALKNFRMRDSIVNHRNVNLNMANSNFNHFHRRLYAQTLCKNCNFRW